MLSQKPIPPMLDSHEDFRTLFDGAPDLLYTQDLQGRITRVNRAFERVTGYSRREAIGMNILDFIAPEHRELVRQNIMERIGGATGHPLEIDILTRDGARLPFEITTELIFEKGLPAGAQCFGRDIGERKQELLALSAAKAELTEKTEQLAAFTRHLRVLHRLSTTSWNHLDTLFSDYIAAGCEIFGVPAGAITQITDDGLTVRAAHGAGAIVEDPAAAEVLAARATVVSSGRDGGQFSFYAGTPLFCDGVLFGAIGFWSLDERSGHPHAREIIELMAQGIATAVHQRQLNDQLTFLATHDPLTSLPNRLLLLRRLEAALARARVDGSLAALMFIDLDRFKAINDSLGHAVGDAVLQQVAMRLQGALRPEDTLARMGGDEFTAILPSITGRGEAVEIAQRLLRALRVPCSVDGYELFVTASIGISMFPRDGLDAGTLLRNADAAMYSAKRRSSDDVQLYAVEDTNTAVERLSLETSLRRALERGELRLLFQPQVDLRGRLAGAEVLLQWHHPEHGRVSPAQFIPIAEETGMILPIGEWVLREACRQSTEWLRAGGTRLTIAVNVSAVQFAQPSFVSSVAKVLEDVGLPADMLELEVTETVLLRDLQQVAHSLSELRQLGVRIAIDDFGTGYSSLSYIRNLPLDALKIDRSFLDDPGGGRASAALVRAIVALGHTLGLTVTAEGVETERQFRLIRDAGCDFVQGHLFGAALNAAMMEELLRTPQPVFRDTIPRRRS